MPLRGPRGRAPSGYDAAAGKLARERLHRLASVVLDGEHGCLSRLGQAPSPDGALTYAGTHGYSAILEEKVADGWSLVNNRSLDVLVPALTFEVAFAAAEVLNAEVSRRVVEALSARR